MIDKNFIYNKLVSGFIKYQYRLEHPEHSPGESGDEGFISYRDDRIFYLKVHLLVNLVMEIIGDNIKDSDSSADKLIN